MLSVRMIIVSNVSIGIREQRAKLNSLVLWDDKGILAFEDQKTLHEMA